jgi:F-type H+-transporting ATPase subunit b
MFEIDPGLIIWTFITFVALLVILRVVAWKPILGVLEQREQTIRDSLDKARQAKEEAETLMAQHREMIGKARQEMAAIIEKAQRDAEQRRSDILARAHGEAEQKARQFAEDLERQKRAAIREIRAEAVDLVVSASSRLVAANLDEEKHRSLVRDYLDDLKTLED